MITVYTYDRVGGLEEVLNLDPYGPMPSRATLEEPPEHEDGEFVVWTGSSWEVVTEKPMYPETETPTYVPEAVSRAQGKAALILAGLWDAVTQYVEGIEDNTTKLLAETALYDTQEWRRDSPFLVECAAALGMSSEDLDELFINAAEIKL